MKKNDVKIVILAAGKGTRMQSDLPKVLSPLKGKPMLKHVLKSINKAHNEKPIAIIGHRAELVQKEFGELFHYAFQLEQLGTGHAVACAKEHCGETEHIVVLSGDQPLISSKTIKKLIKKHLESKEKITFTTTTVSNFKDWRKAFLTFGRILRKNGKVIGIREYKDASEKEKEIKEVNAGCYVFDAKWLWKNLKEIKNKNTQNEYYLTDLFHIASKNKEKIETIKIQPREALSANTKEDLEVLENFVI